MRPIKFRAWDKKHKVMANHLNARGLNLAGDDIVAYAPECEWMQFTGLLDKNGTPIFEGDILDDKINPYHRRVEWSVGRNVGFNIRNGERYEIIGNIYENPELFPLTQPIIKLKR